MGKSPGRGKRACYPRLRLTASVCRQLHVNKFIIINMQAIVPSPRHWIPLMRRAVPCCACVAQSCASSALAR